MFFLTNHLLATLLAKEQETLSPAMQEASFMVNKTSTIKRICDSCEAQDLKGDLVCSKRDPEEGVQKCEADVQMQRTRVTLQALNYDTLSGFLPVHWSSRSSGPRQAHLRK
jgi:hypothetical protein